MAKEILTYFVDGPYDTGISIIFNINSNNKIEEGLFGYQK